MTEVVAALAAALVLMIFAWRHVGRRRPQPPATPEEPRWEEHGYSEGGLTYGRSSGGDSHSDEDIGLNRTPEDKYHSG